MAGGTGRTCRTCRPAEKFDCAWHPWRAIWIGEAVELSGGIAKSWVKARLGYSRRDLNVLFGTETANLRCPTRFVALRQVEPAPGRPVPMATEAPFGLPRPGHRLGRNRLAAH